MSQRYFTYPMVGGLDLISPPLNIKAGRLLACKNYEAQTQGGYKRSQGYERFSGLPSPSTAEYWLLPFNNGSSIINAGDVVTGLVSGAQANVLAVVLTSGAWDGTGVGHLVITDLANVFADAEAIQVAGATKASVINGASLSAEEDSVLHVQYRLLAINTRRANILAVPGSGNILGVWMFQNTVYAFRNNAAGDACLMYRATSTGWVLIVTPVLAPNGRYEFVNYNFTGATYSAYFYGCDGVNKAFQFDGTTLTQITTGMTLDTPEHIVAHKNHLILSFDSSLQYSAIGDPLVWTVITGAGEIATGDSIVGFDVQVGGVLAVFNRNSTYLLYGTIGASDMRLDPINLSAGAIEWSIQHFNQAVYLDDRGITNLSATQSFGDFKAGSISFDIDPWLQNLNTRVIASIRYREKNQYYLFFEDGNILLMLYNGRQKPQFTALNFTHKVRCICSAENTEGKEQIYYGSDNGYVYHLNNGNDFDGELIDYSLRMAFSSLGSPRHKKRFFKVEIEVDAPMAFPMNYSAEFSYANPDTPASVAQLVGAASVVTGGAFLDANDNWGAFQFDGQVVGVAETYLSGVGVNISLLLNGSSNYEPPHTLFGGTYFYSQRGLKR